MAGHHDSTIRWSISRCDARETSARGRAESKSLLGDVFVLWLRDRGDVSNWANAPLLGAIVHAYSDLSLPVVAVLLGIELETLWDAEVPSPSPPWEFDGPNGEELVVDRQITKEVREEWRR